MTALCHTYSRDTYYKANLRSEALFHYPQQKFQANISKRKKYDTTILPLQVRNAELSKQ